MTYSPYPDFACRSPSAKQASASMKPMRMAISSMQAMRMPCRFSNTRTYSPASSNDSWVPVSSQAKPRPRSRMRAAPRSRYARLMSVISSSPRADGRSPDAIATTSLS